jgi:hypothetical protein
MLQKIRKSPVMSLKLGRVGVIKVDVHLDQIMIPEIHEEMIEEIEVTVGTTEMTMITGAASTIVHVQDTMIVILIKYWTYSE